MANYLRNQLAKTMTRYFKNIDPDQFTLSFFRGEAELTNLELRPEVLQQLLGLPPWLILRKASIASIRCVVTWTKIKTVPIKIIIDEMQLKLEVTGSPAEKDFVELNPEDYGYTDGPVKAEKYGFIDGVTDGVEIKIECIDVTIVAPDFLGTIHIIHVSLASCDENWGPTEDLRKSKIEDKTKNTLTLFKLLKIHELRGVISPMTPRIAEAAQSDPFTFNIKEPRLRIFKRKSLLDNTKVLSMHMTLDISLIRQELSRFQIQTINHMLASTSKMMSQTRGMKFNRLPDVEGADNTSMADHGFHIKIKKLELWLKNHRNARPGSKVDDQYLTSLLMTTVTIHHFAEQPMGAQLRSKNALRQAYLTECGAWTKSVNSKWAKSVSLSKSDKARLRQAATSVTVEAVKIVTRRSASTKEQVNQKRYPKAGRSSEGSIDSRRLSDDGILLGDSDQSPSETTPDDMLVELLQSNYTEYHLPPDLALVQLDMVSYFIVDSASVTSPSARGGLGSPGGGRREVPLPAPIMYSRVNPCKVQVNLSAMLQFLDFANSCSVGTPVFGGDNTPAAVSELGIQISLCTTQAKLTPLLEQIGTLSESVEQLVSPDDIKELHRVHSVRTEMLETSLAALETEEEDTSFQRFSIELSLPTLVLPGRVEGPSRVRELELRLICSRAKITNCLAESRFSGSMNFDAFYRSPIVSDEGPQMTSVPLTVVNDGCMLHPLPNRAWLPTSTQVDSPSTMHVHVDQMWGDLFNTRTGVKTTMMRPTTMSVWTFDATRHIEELAELDASRITSDEPGPELSATSTEQSSNYAASYTMVSLPQQLQLDINNSVYLFLMRFLDEFSRLNALLDDGNELPQGFTFIAINEIGVSLFAEPHMLPGVSDQRATDQRAMQFKEAFHHVHIKKLHNVSYSGQREGVALLAIEQLEMSGAARVANPDEAVQHDWTQVAVALRMANSFPTPEHAYTFYQQLDQLMLYKEAMAAEAQSPGMASPLSPQLQALEERPAIARATGGGGGGEADDSFMSAVSEMELDTKRSATPENDFQEVAVTSTPLGLPRRTKPVTGALGGRAPAEAVPLADSPLGMPVALVDSPLGSASVTPVGERQGRSTTEAFAMNIANFELKHLPSTEMEMQLQNLDLELDSDEVAMLGAFTEDYYPDDVFPATDLRMSVNRTTVTMLDRPTAELKALEAFRLISPTDTARTSYGLNGVSVTKTGNTMQIESLSTVGSWDPEKENQKKSIARLLGELERAKAELSEQKDALDVANGKLARAERAQAISLQALAQQSQS